MKKQFTFFSLGIVLTLSLYSQTIALEKVYNWSTSDVIKDFIPTDDNGYALLGISGFNSFVLKLDSNCDSLWTYIIDTNTNPASQLQIIQSMNSDLIIASKIDEKGFLLRLSSSGDSITSITWPPQYEKTSFIGVLEQNNGDLIVNHRIEQNGGYAPPIATLRCYSSDGNLKWSQGLGYNYPNDIILTSDNEIVATGVHDDWSTMQIWIAKFDSIGNTIYSHNMGSDAGMQIIESSSEDLYAAVNGYSAPQGTYDAIKLSSDGTEQWKLYDNNGSDGSYSTICELEPSYFAIGGTKDGALLIKVINENGDSISNFTYSDHHSQHAIRIFTDDEHLVVGAGKKDTNNNRSILIVKILLDSLYIGTNHIYNENYNILAVFPNPATDIVDFSSFQDTPEPVTVNVYDLNGKLYFSEYFSERKPLILNVETLRPGSYVANVYSNSNTSYFKFIIAN